MTTTDEITIWRYIRHLHEAHHRVAVSNEALRRLCADDGFFERLATLEKAVSTETSQIHGESLREIDDRIRKLMGI